MASKRLRRIDLDPLVKDRLNYHNFKTVKDVLSKTPFELIKCLGLGYLTVTKLLLQVSRACAPSSVSALELWRSKDDIPKFLATSLPHLDQVLHGGLPVGTITEIAGPSGCGKTQFCMMMSLLATHRAGGLNSEVVYIDTEAAFSAQRFIEIAQNRFPDVYHSDERLTELCSKVHIIHEASCDSLLNRLENLEEFIIAHHVKFIVIDSIASLIRKEFDSSIRKNLISRTNLLSSEAAILKRLAEDFLLPVLVTNQVTTRYDSGCSLSDNLNEDSGETSYVTAALGNTWSHCVNTRLILQYVDAARRQILVAKSPVAPFANFTFTIQPSGFVLQDGTGESYEGTDPGLQKIRVRSSLPPNNCLY